MIPATIHFGMFSDLDELDRYDDPLFYFYENHHVDYKRYKYFYYNENDEIVVPFFLNIVSIMEQYESIKFVFFDWNIYGDFGITSAEVMFAKMFFDDKVIGDPGYFQTTLDQYLAIHCFDAVKILNEFISGLTIEARKKYLDIAKTSLERCEYFIKVHKGELS